MEPEHDFHAGAIETSLMMYWKPELVKNTIVMDEPEIARMMRTDQDWFEKVERKMEHKTHSNKFALYFLFL
ncbi:MAG TPA: creatininase family protein [Clostridiales bacterium]|nr:creatininase family protein [Clostridiales bacterium]